MLRPFLIIGVGGSGGKTLRGLKYQLELKLQQAGWAGGIPAAWQFLHFDTPTVQDGVDYPAPFLPAQEYKGLVSAGANYDTVFKTIEGAHAANQKVHADVERQLPDARRVRVDVTKGAGQFRAVGRAVALSATRDIAVAARAAIARLGDASALAELQTLGRALRAREESANSSPTVIVVSSVAGGSGAGQFLDVIEIVKSTAKQYPWSNEVFSILYAPDVFDQLGVTAGTPGNALAAIAETMNGFWTDTPSPSTIELLQTQGVAPSYGGARDRVGAAYPFIVGRSNSKVTFADQSEVYSAVAASLSAWITDDRVQDSITAYASGNWQARVSANVLPDNTGLTNPAHHSPAFSSMGFGRVTLGRDKFFEYSAERLARSVIDKMLYAHTETDPLFAQRTEVEWISVRADQDYQRFIRDLRLNEDTEEHNDVIDRLRATEQLESLKARLSNDILTKLGDPAQLDKNGGLDLTTWSQRLLAQWGERAPELLQEDRGHRQNLLDEWIRVVPDELLFVIATHVATAGLPVVMELLTRLDRMLKSAADGLAAEARTHEDWAQSLPSLVSEELQGAPNQQSIRPDQDAVLGAVERMQQALGWASEAPLRYSAAQLLNELRSDFLAPLRTYLEGAYEELSLRVKARKTSDDRDNDYDFWPKSDDETVPRKYTPAPNERLLVEQGEYPGEFKALVRSTASTNNDRFSDAMREVVQELLVGVSAHARDEADAASWSFIAQVRAWSPAVTASRETTRSPQNPRFSMATTPDVYVERARLWMRREGTAFNAYVTEDLRSFFDEDSVLPDVFGRRRDKFREQLQAALGASEPLVKLNPTLLRLVHDKATNESTSLVFSSIPFKAGTEMYAVTKQVLGAMGFWNDAISDSWFQDARVEGIEVFAMSGFPYQPIVMDSVMEPIARDWLRQSNTQESREAFWRFKRSRLLGEAIPADPTVISAMLRGWYVAKALGRLKVEQDDGDRGPGLAVWDASARRFVDFPRPLLDTRRTKPYDFPGVVMQSLTIALALCNSQESLAPLRAYQVLAQLGGDELEMSSTLLGWVQEGKLEAEAPVPDAGRAGDPSGALSGRQQSLRDYFSGEYASFRSQVAEHDFSVSVYDYPVSWEIRHQVAAALQSLSSAVMATRAADSGV
ncbi:tubulin-like doman-containing protein [Microbacterium sp. NPDC076768]|uniref:tubulin-like doman-containing protein n=1 Tax=Microbacterium sp. NPDC076768 TaxID=3154858 RepID=UPI00341785B8